MRLNIFSPVHIGSGEEKSLSPYADYIYQNDYIYYVNHTKLENWLLSQDNSDEIMNEFILGIKKQKGLREFFYKYSLSVKDYSTHSIPIVGDPKKEKIERTITNAGLPYIPGSSIKGAIRTAILWKIKKEEGLGNIYSIKKYHPYIGQDIFGKFGDDVMNFLQVTDTETYPREDIEIRNIKRVSVTRPKQQEIPTWLEVINSQKEVEFEIKQKGEKTDKIRNELTDFLTKGAGLTSIFKALNEFSKEIAEFEINALKNPYFNPIVKFYKELIEQINQLTEREAVLRIGYGKTFFDNTIDLLFKDDKEVMEEIKEMTSKNPKYRVGYSRATGKPVKPFPISRWLYFDANGSPKGILGWIKIKED